MKVSSATRPKERHDIGDRVTEWLRANASMRVAKAVVARSSDRSFHCYSLVLFCREERD